MDLFLDIGMPSALAASNLLVIQQRRVHFNIAGVCLHLKWIFTVLVSLEIAVVAGVIAAAYLRI